MHRDIEILDTDKKVGIINQTKITKQTKIPLKDEDEIREQVA
tara:strand:- start:1407 stop:1532 length:126 start_codon:yes stop_codon:yes gene_type:complete